MKRFLKATDGLSYYAIEEIKMAWIEPDPANGKNAFLIKICLKGQWRPRVVDENLVESTAHSRITYLLDHNYD